MKKIKLSVLMLTFTLIAAMVLPGCETIEKTKKLAEKKGDILESAYFVDKETGEFKTVVIIQNNSEEMLLQNLYKAYAFDENGNSIEEYEEEDASGMTVQYGVSALCYWLGSGEKTALAWTSDFDISSYDMGNKITDCYKSIPETLEWELTESYDKQLMATWAKSLQPHGLSVKECSVAYAEQGYTEYEVTLHNDSNTGYTGDSSSRFTTDTGEFQFEFRVVAVYRDSDGNIKDVISMLPMSDQETEIAAGSDASLLCFSMRTNIYDPDPEYYIYISDLQRIAN